MTLRVAVIGAGHLGRIHTRLVQNISQVQSVMVADPCPETRARIEEEFSVDTYADWQGIIDQIDAAIIATPTACHHEVACELIRQGKHLLIEKPVTTTLEQAQELLALAQTHHVKVQVGHVERYNPAFSQASKIGVPRFVQACRASGYTFRSIDVGVVLDLMIHDIDLVCHLAQSPISSVHAIGFSVFGKHEDITQARLQFENGLVANLSASRCSPTPNRQFEIYGNQGYANMDLGAGTVDLIQPPTWLSQRDFDLDRVDPETQTWIREQLFESIMPPERLEVEKVNAIQCEQENWIDAILDPAVELSVPLEDGTRALDIALQVVEQINQHAWTSDDSIRGPLAFPNAIEQASAQRKVA